ncbi:Acg family FMN-binding oxidoreductase [Actinophytocola sp. NPDC049390]|uniref:Acg family FMN-binding oxidoreductase n=1 Tax=Actinophytocola sp. NPDC049390 TaxID=3363894 RepID=UPI00379C644C
MNAGGPDDRTVREALRLANQAPSVHNTQPWRWLIGDHTVHLMADWSRHVPATDPDGRDLLVSCGAALQHLRVALAAVGWHTTVHRLPGGDLDTLAKLEMAPREPAEEVLALASAIPRRHTDRRGFTSWPVPSGHLDLMTRYAAEEGGLLVPVTDSRQRHVITTAITAASWWQETDPSYQEELARWSGRGPASDDGVLAASTPATGRVHGDTPMRAFSGGGLVDADTGPGGDEGQLLVLGTQDDDVVARLRAGEAASAALLAATSLGLATCPLSQPLEVRNTRVRIRDEVLRGTAYPQLVLRVGWVPTSAAPLPRSHRRPLHDTFLYLPGSKPDR